MSSAFNGTVNYTGAQQLGQYGCQMLEAQTDQNNVTYGYLVAETSCTKNDRSVTGNVAAATTWNFTATPGGYLIKDSSGLCLTAIPTTGSNSSTHTRLDQCSTSNQQQVWTFSPTA